MPYESSLLDARMNFRRLTIFDTGGMNQSSRSTEDVGRRRRKLTCHAGFAGVPCHEDVECHSAPEPNGASANVGSGDDMLWN